MKNVQLRFCSEVACAMSLLTNVSRIGGEQDTDLTDASMARDFEDIKKIMQFFINHIPFNATSTDLWNIINRIKDSKNKAAAENADIIERNIHSR